MKKITQFNIKYDSILNKYGVDTKIRRQHFFTQLWHESKLTPVSENLNYSAQRLIDIFPKYFDKNSALLYARNPEKIANRVYANRMGNGNESSGDGYKYRGRGYIQLTGKENYTKCSKETSIDIVSNPDLLLNENNSMIAACWFWKVNNINEFADKDDLRNVRKRVNGGTIGIEECRVILNELKKLI